MGAFDHLEWTYNGAFEQLFGLGRGALEKKIPKIQMPAGVAQEGMFKLQFDWYIRRESTIIDYHAPCEQGLMVFTLLTILYCSSLVHLSCKKNGNSSVQKIC